MTTPGGPSGGQGKTGTLLHADTLAEAKAGEYKLPEVIRPNWKRFTNSASSKYRDFSVTYAPDGGYIFKTVKPGNVPGSRAEYYKEVDAFGVTTACYKLTYDPQGNLVHRKDKM